MQLYHGLLLNHIGIIMSDKIIELAVENEFSTYGSLTSQRILSQFHIHLSNEELKNTTKNPLGVYQKLLRIPLKNILNGIILQQAHDYQVYAQKLFINYLLSGEENKSEESPGANTREELELERTQLMHIGENFNQCELAHQQLISGSQASLIKSANEVQKALKHAGKKCSEILLKQNIIKDELFVKQAIQYTINQFDHMTNKTLAKESSFWITLSEELGIKLSDEIRQQLADVLDSLNDPIQDVDNILLTYVELTDDMGINLRSYRAQFYDIILRVTELTQLLPDYTIDKNKEEENRSSLYFDAHIGGD